MDAEPVEHAEGYQVLTQTNQGRRTKASKLMTQARSAVYCPSS